MEQTRTVMSIWYADDSAVLEHDIKRLQWLIHTLTRLLRDIGLVINVRKTKLMVTAKWDGRVQPVDHTLRVGDVIVSLVEEFLYTNILYYAFIYRDEFRYHRSKTLFKSFHLKFI